MAALGDVLGARCARPTNSGDSEASSRRLLAINGAASTLRVRVNDLLWNQAAGLYGQDASAQVYTARQSDDGKTSVQFGDGSSGARPPSGSENIVAVYRVGSGQAGNVAAGQINMLQSRPLGLKGVSNPLPETSGDNPEAREQARRNAPSIIAGVNSARCGMPARCSAGCRNASIETSPRGRRM